MSGHLSNQPFQLKRRGVEFNLIDPRNYGIDFYRDNLFASEEEIRTNPERAGEVDACIGNLTTSSNLIHRRGFADLNVIAVAVPASPATCSAALQVLRKNNVYTPCPSPLRTWRIHHDLH